MKFGSTSRAQTVRFMAIVRTAATVQPLLEPYCIVHGITPVDILVPYRQAPTESVAQLKQRNVFDVRFPLS